MSSLFSNIKHVPSSPSEVLVNCPFCEKKGKTPDVDQHLYINVNTNRYICHRCNSFGQNIYSVIPELKYHEEFSRTDLLEYFNKVEKVYFKLEEVSKDVEKGSFVHRYIVGRRLPWEDVEHYNIREGVGEYQGRLLIPNFELGSSKCDFFITRSISSKTYPRYKNPTAPRKNVLMNYYNVQEKNIVFLCEGWFTGRSFGRNFVCTLGTVISRGQAMKASELSNLFYCPDGDVKYEIIIRNLKQLLRFRRRVFLVPIPRIDKFDADNLSWENKEKAYKNSREFANKDLNITEKELEAWFQSVFPLPKN